MRRAPLVSIVVGFLDAQLYLEETIASVLGQSLGDWELLLVDDGSTDASGAIARLYADRHPERIFYLSHPGHANRGVCASRNLGLARACGRFVAILDADDVWERDKLREQAEILMRCPEIGMVYGRARYWQSWRETGGLRASDYTPALGIQADTVHAPPSLLLRCFPLGRATAPCPSDLLLRRQLVEAVRGFEESFTGVYQMYEDQAFLAKVYLSAAVHISSSTWTRYRLHADSCCYRVESSGSEPTARRYYFDWLEEYLHTQRVADPRIHRALQRAQRRSRSRWSGRLQKGTEALKRQVKKLLPR